jgi:hypothetical protein
MGVIAGQIVGLWVRLWGCGVRLWGAAVGCGCGAVGCGCWSHQSVLGLLARRRAAPALVDVRIEAHALRVPVVLELGAFATVAVGVQRHGRERGAAVGDVGQVWPQPPPEDVGKGGVDEARALAVEEGLVFARRQVGRRGRLQPHAVRRRNQPLAFGGREELVDRDEEVWLAGHEIARRVRRLVAALERREVRRRRCRRRRRHGVSPCNDRAEPKASALLVARMVCGVPRHSRTAVGHRVWLGEPARRKRGAPWTKRTRWLPASSVQLTH